MGARFFEYSIVFVATWHSFRFDFFQKTPFPAPTYLAKHHLQFPKQQHKIIPPTAGDAHRLVVAHHDVAAVAFYIFYDVVKVDEELLVDAKKALALQGFLHIAERAGYQQALAIGEVELCVVALCFASDDVSEV